MHGSITVIKPSIKSRRLGGKLRTNANNVTCHWLFGEKAESVGADGITRCQSLRSAIATSSSPIPLLKYDPTKGIAPWSLEPKKPKVIPANRYESKRPLLYNQIPKLLGAALSLRSEQTSGEHIKPQCNELAKLKVNTAPNPIRVNGSTALSMASAEGPCVW